MVKFHDHYMLSNSPFKDKISIFSAPITATIITLTE